MNSGRTQWLPMIAGTLLLLTGTARAAPQPPRSATASDPSAARPHVEMVGVSTANTGSKGSFSLTVGRPQGVVAGDVLLAIVSSDYAHAGPVPTGWTLVRQDLKAREDLAVQSYFRVASAKEPASYTWTLVSSLYPASKGLAAATMMAFRNVDTAQPVFSSAVRAETPDRTKLECPSAESPVGGMLVCGWVLDDPDSITAPAGMAQVSNFTYRHDDTAAAAYQEQATGGPTGLRVARINNVPGGSNDFSQAIVLRPRFGAAPTCTPPTPGDAA